MSQTERDQFLALIKNKKEELSGNRQASLLFLRRVGIITQNGTLRKEYKNLCIPPKQD